MSEADVLLLLEKLRTHLAKHVELIKKRRTSMEELTRLTDQLIELNSALVESDLKQRAKEDATTLQLEADIERLENLRSQF